MQNRLQFWQERGSAVPSDAQVERIVEAIIANSPTLQSEAKFRKYLRTLDRAALQARLAQTMEEGRITPTSSIHRERQPIGMI